MIRTILILVIILSFFSISSAQEDALEGSTGAEPFGEFSQSLEDQKNEFDTIKQEIGRLLVDNKKFEAEYQALKQQLDELKGTFETKEKRFEKFVPKNMEEERDQQRRINSLKALYQDVEKLKNEIMMKKSRTTYLTTQLIDLEEKQRLWKMKLTELEITKREIELDIRMKEYEVNEHQRGKDATLNELQDKIQKALDEERELLSRISAIEDGVYYSPAKAVELETQNDELTLRVQSLEKDLEFAHRETEILEKKRLLASKSRGSSILKKQVEKRELEGQVEELRRRMEQLNALMDESIARKAEKEGLLQSFVQMEQDNQKLRTQIEEMESKINSFNN
ncbi:MAG TPA: hypothetical protein VI749_09035 [Candidatus Omnitrophota bacterium]|nr:hypothetical protein [Candidatus Omnitrophota bacterium]